jgi:hypothetical protein
MRRKNLTRTLTIMLLVLANAFSAAVALPPLYDLRVEHLRTPVVGITAAAPRFSWRLR